METEILNTHNIPNDMRSAMIADRILFEITDKQENKTLNTRSLTMKKIYKHLQP